MYTFLAEFYINWSYCTAQLSTSLEPEFAEAGVKLGPNQLGLLIYSKLGFQPFKNAAKNISCHSP